MYQDCPNLLKARFFSENSLALLMHDPGQPQLGDTRRVASKTIGNRWKHRKQRKGIYRGKVRTRECWEIAFLAYCNGGLNP